MHSLNDFYRATTAALGLDRAQQLAIFRSAGLEASSSLIDGFFRNPGDPRDRHRRIRADYLLAFSRELDNQRQMGGLPPLAPLERQIEALGERMLLGDDILQQWFQVARDQGRPIEAMMARGQP